MRENHPDWPRFAGEVDKRMMAMTPEAQMNPQYWEITYLTVKGEVADKLVAEGVTEALKARDNPVERPTPKGTEPAKPKELSDDERRVAGKFGMGVDSYRKAADRYDSEEGRLPLTLDSKKPKVPAGMRKKA
jgi:hypothetical protein